jgi:hypothetical protein
VNYAEYRKYYRFYNPAALEEEKLINNFSSTITPTQNTKDSLLTIFKNYVINFNLISNLNYIQDFKTNIQRLVNRKIMKPLVSTTERVVDVVLSVTFY